MTPEELRALPIFEPFDYVEVPVVDGRATAPNGVELRNLKGLRVKFPVQKEQRAAFPVKPNTPMAWRGDDLRWWRAVRLVSGEWRREQV